MKKIILASAFIVLTLSAIGQNTVHDYVKRYEDIAVTEMKRSGIPASIILAQGILSSTFGNSKLALLANNHFSVKCSDFWDGDFYYKWTDEMNSSCFKVYDNPEDSYYDHIDYMMQDARFNNLFANDISEYKRWAKGLGRLGFTKTDEYAKELIDVIEQFQLHEFDSRHIDLVNTKTTTKTKKNKKTPKSYEQTEDDIIRNNGVKAVKAKAGDTPLAIAIQEDIPFEKIKKFNDLTANSEFAPNQFVYLQSKKNKYRGEKDFHVVKNWETVHEISQLYGIKLKALQKFNKLVTGEEVMNGQQLNLKKTVAAKPKLRPTDFKKPAMPKPDKKITSTKPKKTYPTPPGNKKPKTRVGKNKPSQPTTATKPLPQPPKERIPTHKPKVTHTKHQPTRPSTTPAVPGKNSKERYTPPPPPPTKPEKVISSEIVTTPSKPKPTVTPVIPAKVNTTGKIVHIVQKGETVYRISKMYNTTVEDIQAWNKMSDYLIEIGQELVVGIKP